MRIDINLNMVTDRTSLHDTIKRTLPLPDYEGHNLDALADALLSIRGETEIAFHEMDKMFDLMPQYTERLLYLCIDLEKRSPNLTFLFYR